MPLGYDKISSQLFIGNSHFYIFVRLYHIVMERLAAAQEMAIAAKEEAAALAEGESGGDNEGAAPSAALWPMVAVARIAANSSRSSDFGGRRPKYGCLIRRASRSESTRPAAASAPSTSWLAPMVRRHQSSSGAFAGPVVRAFWVVVALMPAAFVVSGLWLYGNRRRFAWASRGRPAPSDRITAPGSRSSRSW